MQINEYKATITSNYLGCVLDESMPDEAMALKV